MKHKLFNNIFLVAIVVLNYACVPTSIKAPWEKGEINIISGLADDGTATKIFGARSPISITNSSSVILTIDPKDDTSEMFITQNADCSTGGTWETYSASKAWALTNLNASNDIYIKVRNSSLVESSCTSISIVHDNIAPTSNSLTYSSGKTSTNSSAPILTPDASVSPVQMYLTNTAGCASGGTWETYNTSKSWTLPNSNASNLVYIKYRDTASNESTCTSLSLDHDTIAPILSSLDVSTGTTSTASSTIDITMSSSGTPEQMYITNTIGCSSGGSWNAYASPSTWTLTSLNSSNTVYVKVRDEATNESTCLNYTITHDNTGPSSHSIVLDGGSVFTSTTTSALTLAAGDSPTEMYITNTATCSGGGVWEAYSTSKVWILPSTNATNTVYAKFRDALANESTCVSDSITHDIISPTATTISINSGMSGTSITSSMLTLLATGTPTDMYVTNTATCSGGGAWETYSTSKAWVLPNLNATNTVYVKFRDAINNESTCIDDSILHDNIGPSLSSVVLDSGNLSTNSPTVSLSMTSSGSPTQMYITENAGCSTGGSWVSYAAPTNWTLTATNTTANVYVKLRDVGTNESSCLTDSIVHDSNAPTSPTISIDGGAIYTSTLTSSLTLSAATGPSEMYITNTAGCASGGAWESYSTSKSWTLASGNSTNTVYVKYRDTALNETSCVNDTIIHDNTAPSSPTISINSGMIASSLTSSTLTLSAGLSPTDMYITNSSGCSAGGVWETYNVSKAWTLPDLNSTNTIYIKYRDIVNNETSCINDTIVHDNIAPTSPSLIINNGDVSAYSLGVSLSPTASGSPSDMYITNTSGCATGGSWESFGLTSWTITTTDAANTVYAKYKDSAGNTTGCVNDSINHLSAPPELTGLSAISVSTSTATLSWTSGGVPTAGFMIKYIEGAVAPVDCVSGLDTGNVVSRKVIGLKGNTQYSFRVCGYVGSAHTAGETVTTTTLDGSISSACIADVSPQTSCTDIGAGTIGNPYLICTHQQLNTIDITTACKATGVYVKLGADIDLASYPNTFNQIEDFLGDFNGDYYTIKNYTCSGGAYQGLFKDMAGVGGASTIRNLVLDNFDVTTSNNHAGALIGYDGHAGANIISNITVKNSKITGEKWVGGLAGRITTGTLSNIMVVSTTVTGSRSVGGVVGSTTSSTFEDIFSSAEIKVPDPESLSSNSYEIGGILGTSGSTLSKAYSYATIHGLNYNEKVGGVVGTTGAANTKIKSYAVVYGGQKSTGGITGYGSCSECSFSGIVHGEEHVGGLSGYMTTTDTYDSYSDGSIHASANINQTYMPTGVSGGITGYAGYRDVERVYASGDIYSTGPKVGGLAPYYCSGVTSSFFTGNILAQDTTDIGYICGETVAATTRDIILYNSSTCSSDNQSCLTDYYDTTESSMSYFYNQTNIPYVGISNWDFASTWEISKTNTLPIHQWEQDPVHITSTADSSTQVTINWKHRKATTSGFIIKYNTGSVYPSLCDGGTDIGLTDNYIISGLTNYQQVSGIICPYDSSNQIYFPVRFSARSQNLLTSSPPSSLAFTHASNRRHAQISWVAGRGNGDKSGCKLQYFSTGLWRDLIFANKLNCDEDVNLKISLNSPMDSAYSNASVRVVRKSDSSPLATFPSTINCTPGTYASIITHTIDENCDGYFHNYVLEDSTVYSNPTASGLVLYKNQGARFCIANGFNGTDPAGLVFPHTPGSYTYCSTVNTTTGACDASTATGTGVGIITSLTCANVRSY